MDCVLGRRDIFSIHESANFLQCQSPGRSISNGPLNFREGSEFLRWEYSLLDMSYDVNAF
jgi:hypothetical protein